MSHRFRLRTLFIVFTIVALCVGANLAVWKQLGYTSALLGETFLLASTLTAIPLYLTCAIGAIVIYDQRRECLFPSRLALCAVIVGVAWQVFAPLVTLPLTSWASSIVGIRWSGIGTQFLSRVVDTICWGLLLMAFLQASSCRKTTQH